MRVRVPRALARRQAQVRAKLRAALERKKLLRANLEIN